MRLHTCQDREYTFSGCIQTPSVRPTFPRGDARVAHLRPIIFLSTLLNTNQTGRLIITYYVERCQTKLLNIFM